MQVNKWYSWFLMVGSQIGNLTPCPSFGHNLCFKYPNGSFKLMLDIYVSRTFQWYKELINPMSFDPCNCPSKIQEWSSGVTFHAIGNVWVRSFTFSYTPKSMKCDSWASLLAYTFANLCLGREPKVRVVTNWAYIWNDFICIHFKTFKFTSFIEKHVSKLFTSRTLYYSRRKYT
jgi:hypothetical protein